MMRTQHSMSVNGGKNRTSQEPRGPRGATGATGKTGHPGPTGATGKMGERGPRGRIGPAGPAVITRDEFEAAMQSINANFRSLEIQFRRIAQIQAELDELKRVVARLPTNKQP
jgi:hypothetical protein